MRPLAQVLFALSCYVSIFLFLVTCHLWSSSYRDGDVVGYQSEWFAATLQSRGGQIGFVFDSRTSPTPSTTWLDRGWFHMEESDAGPITDNRSGFAAAGRQVITGVDWTATRSSLVVPTWLLALLFAVPSVGIIVHRIRQSRRLPGLCPKCGYDLRTSPGRCPECGNTGVVSDDSA